MKKLLTLLAPLSLVILMFLTLPSCVAPVGGPVGYGGGYGGSGPVYYQDDGWDDDGFYGTSGVAYTRPGYGYGYGGPVYSNGFVGGGWNRGWAGCSVCRRNPCTCNRGLVRHSTPTIRVNGHQHKATDSFPEGYHNLSWYKNRGYNLKEYKVQSRDGHTHDLRGGGRGGRGGNDRKKR
jgi:hypothetical protein